MKRFLNKMLAAIGSALFVAAAHAVVLLESGFGVASIRFLLVIGLSFAIPLLLAWLVHSVKLLRVLFFACCAAYFFDVLFVVESVASAPVILLVFALVMAVLWSRHGDQACLFLVVSAVMVVLLSIPQLTSQARALAPSKLAMPMSSGRRDDLPVYVHIILDEQGPLALMPREKEFDAIRSAMLRDYAERGFSVFEDTGVISGSTHVSLGQVFSEQDGNTRGYKKTGGSTSYTVESNYYFDVLDRKGYDLRVLQSSYLDLCASDDSRCQAYSRGGTGASIDRYHASIGVKFWYALLELHYSLIDPVSARSALFYRAAADLASSAGLEVPRARAYLTRPTLVLDMMKLMAAAAGTIEHGDAIIAHFVLPHFPYVLSSNCGLQPPAKVVMPGWMARREGRDVPVDKLQRAYWGQAFCAHKQVMAVVDAVLATPVGKRAIIVIHGDHGSRMYEKVASPFARGISATAKAYALKTHFAVRGLDALLPALSAEKTLRGRLQVISKALPAREQMALDP